MKVIRKYTSNNCQKNKRVESHKLYEKIKEKIMKESLRKKRLIKIWKK